MDANELRQDEDAALLLSALSSLGSADEAAELLLDLCTPREISDLSQRLEVAVLLSQGHSYADVIHATGASSTTVSRVSKCLNGPVGGYRRALARLEREFASCLAREMSGKALPLTSARRSSMS